jgi:hypothetical protein
MSAAGFVVVATLSFAATLVPSVLILVARHRLGVLRAASWLVIWGVVFAAGEHAVWAMRLAFSERRWLNPHSDVHYFMAGVYAAIGGVLLVVVALTLLREGRRAGWLALLFVLLAGGTLELVINGPTGILFQHGLNPAESSPQGTSLFGYLFAWLAALAISWGPIFRSRPNPRTRGGFRIASAAASGDRVADRPGSDAHDDLVHDGLVG